MTTQTSSTIGATSPSDRAQRAAHRRRTLDGRRFERVTVPRALTRDGYEVTFADKSRGVADHVALKPGEILLVAARLTGQTKINPHIRADEWAGIWELAVRLRTPAVTVLPVVATAREWNDEPRYMLITGPRVGRGITPWLAWSPDRVETGPDV